MARYELTFVVRPDVASNHAEQLAEKYGKVVKDAGGKIIKTEQWGLRNLAYRVKKHRKGYYVMLGVEGNGAVIAETERQMRLSDDIIRFLSVRDDSITEALSVVLAPKRRSKFDGESKDSPKPPVAASTEAPSEETVQA